MPMCTFLTNIQASEIPSNFHIELAELIAKVLNKPIERVTVSILPDTIMYRNGSAGPAGVLTVKSIAVFSPEKNPEYAKPIQALIEEKLSLKGSRLAILFHDLDPQDVAYPRLH